MNAKPRLIIQLAIAVMFMVTSAVAVAANDFPGGKPDRHILEAQEKADELFEKGTTSAPISSFEKNWFRWATSTRSIWLVT